MCEALGALGVPERFVATLEATVSAEIHQIDDARVALVEHPERSRALVQVT